ncbi:MAG TPA: hypothetical protein VF215_01630, partial [Thermoanaerobaculia bacterium]
MTLTASNAPSWLWSNGATTQSITVNASGTFTVATSNGSCSTTSAATTVTVNANPPATITATGPTTFCDGGSVTLTANAAPAWLWSNGATTQSIVVTASGTFTVTTSNSGCATTSAPVTVTVNPAPNAAISAPAALLGNSTANAASVVDAGAGATYLWTIANGTITSGQATPNIAFTAGTSGTSTLTVIVNAGGCSATGTTTMPITPTTAPGADLAITKLAPASVQAGAVFAYTLIVSNNGPDAASVSVSDVLPAGTTLVSFAAAPFSCAEFASGIQCTGPLSAFSSKVITINVHAPQTPGTITNTATVSGGPGDPDPSNDSDSATTNVTAAPVQCTTTPPTLIAPASHATVDSPVTFSWSTVDNATAYELWIDSALAGTTNTTTLTLPLPSGDGTWYVVARLAADCTPVVSAQRTFTVATRNTCGSHQRPQLTTPTANANATSPVTFNWTAVAEAIGYRIWIEADNTAPQDLGTTAATTLTAAVPPGAIVAYVDALFSGCDATRSDAVAFRVAATDPCATRAATTPIAPANNSVVNSSSVELRWQPVAHNSGYRIWASIDGAAPTVLGTTDDTTLHAFIERGDVLWFVETLFDGCASTESPRFHFTIPAAQNCGTAVPQLIAPANATTTTNADVLFQWTSVANAVAYEVWLALDHGTPTLLGTTTSTSLTHTVAPGRLEWF